MKSFMSSNVIIGPRKLAQNKLKKINLRVFLNIILVHETKIFFQSTYFLMT